MKNVPIVCLTVVIVALLFGCNHTATKPGKGVHASSFTYALPETKLKVSVTLVLESCAKRPVARATTSITPVANTTDQNVFQIDGNTLKSFFEKREIKVELHENGALKTVNTTSTDATAGIIGGVIKFASVFFAPTGTINAGSCNQDILDAITLRDDLRKRLVTLQGTQATSANPSDVEKNIKAIIQEIARLETGPLQTKLSKSIPIRSLTNMPEEDGGVVRWTYGDFWKWYNVADADKKTGTDAFSLNYCVTAATASASSCDSTVIAGYTGIAALSPAVTLSCGTCDKQLVFREPLKGAVILSAARDGDYFSPKIATSNTVRGAVLKKDASLGRKSVPVSQWGTADFIDLNVGFGESRSLSASFDAFGKKTKFGWTSNARGEGIVGGLNTIADARQTALSAGDGEDIANAKAKIDELETLQKLNKLENCRSILENGGFVCPEE